MAYSQRYVSTGNGLYVVQNVPGDGDCFFHSLSYALHGDCTQTCAYRMQICSFVYNQWNQWCDKAALYHNNNITALQYYNTMVLGNGWGTACEVDAASQLLQCIINVWLLDNKTNKFTQTAFTPNNHPSGNCMSIDVLLEDNHFQVMRQVGLDQAVASQPPYTQQSGNPVSNMCDSQESNDSDCSDLQMLQLSQASLQPALSQSEATQNYASKHELEIVNLDHDYYACERMPRETDIHLSDNKASVQPQTEVSAIVDQDYTSESVMLETGTQQQLTQSSVALASTMSPSEATQNYALQHAQKIVTLDHDYYACEKMPSETDIHLSDFEDSPQSQTEVTQNYSLQCPPKLQHEQKIVPLDDDYYACEKMPSETDIHLSDFEDSPQSQTEVTQKYSLQCLSNALDDHGYSHSNPQTFNMAHLSHANTLSQSPTEIMQTSSIQHMPNAFADQAYVNPALLDHDYSHSVDCTISQNHNAGNLQHCQSLSSNIQKSSSVLPQSEINYQDANTLASNTLSYANVTPICAQHSALGKRVNASNAHTSNAKRLNIPPTSKKSCGQPSVSTLRPGTFTSAATAKPSQTSHIHADIQPTHTHANITARSTHTNKDISQLQSICRQFGIQFDMDKEHETPQDVVKRRRRNMNKLKTKKALLNLSENDIPDAAPITDNVAFNRAMDSIRAFELEQMSYSVKHCVVCHERRLEMKMSKTSDICHRCYSERSPVKMFSHDNNMDPGKMPPELNDLTVVEQQLISRISPCISIHMLKHGGVGSSGHCVTFPQDVGEPAAIFPRLPQEIQIIRVRKQGRNDTSKDFRVRRFKVQNALIFLKDKNPAYSNITISTERLQALPVDGELQDIPTMEYRPDTIHQNDIGPAPQQTAMDNLDEETHSSVLLPEPAVNIQQRVQSVVQDAVGGSHGNVTVNRSGFVTIPWPTRGDVPVSEYTTQYFFTMAFPALFPYGTADYFANRQRTCSSVADWAEHLLWYDDGRFAHHQYFKFVIHNMILRKRAMENSSFIMKQKLGEGHLTVNDLKEKLQQGDDSAAKKILYYSASLRGTSQYWSQRAKELRALIQFEINEGNGLPSFFTTGSCAEFHFKALRRLLTMYVKETTGEDIDLQDRSTLFRTLQSNTHIVAHYFDLRTKSYFRNIMCNLFNVQAFWYRQEFAKSRGMVHFHGLCWRSDKEPHVLIHDAIADGLSHDQCAEKLAAWAESEFGMTACHPAGMDEHGQSRRDMWPPPEGHAPLPPEETNPLVKLLMDASTSQETLLEDYLLLSNRVCLHRCSDYCLRPSKSNSGAQQEKVCRMDFPKEIRTHPAMVKDKHGSLRLEMTRDHPVLVQNSRFHTQGWRANGDISLILSKSGPENPSVNEILATERYITGYACKGNQPTGAVVDLFNDMVNCADESTGASGKSLCTKLLMGTVKRDISAVEAAYELSSLPLYRSSHTFQSVSLSGSRIMQQNSSTLTKSTALDKYLGRDPEDTSTFYTYICKGGKVPVITGCNTQASWPLDDNYCRTMLLLHWPNWRHLSDIKNENCSWVDVMKSFLLSNDCPNFLKAQIETAKQKHNQGGTDDDTSDNEHETENTDDQPEWMDLMRPNPNFDSFGADDCQFDDGGPDYDWSTNAHDYPSELGKNWLETIQAKPEDNSTLQLHSVDVNKLNEEQLFAFNIVMRRLHEYIDGVNEYEPLRMIVSGTAGSGKSYLIKCLVTAIRTLFQSNKSVQVVCPTGNSANLISGVTLHSFFKIPMHRRGSELTAPDGAIGATLQSNCDDVKVLLVDERSLIGATTLGWMEFLCSCGTNKGSPSQQSWGGIPVVVFLGDDVQLPPVMDSPVYLCSSKVPAAMHGALVWQEFTTAVSLTAIVRQSNEEQHFRNLLLSLREYKTTPEQAKWLQQFQWLNLKLNKGEELMQRMSDKGIFVFPTHEEEWNHNKAKLMEVNKTSPVAKLCAQTHGVHSRSAESEKAGGLLSTVFLCRNAKVMLSVNLCVQYGLFNGAIGTVVDIVYMNGRRPTDALPDVVMVDFPNYIGPAFIVGNSSLVPIVPVSRKLDCRCHFCTRKQIPLRLGWATTIHRCQGMTIGSGETNRYIVINPGSRSFESRNPGALFVALSRAKSTGVNNTDPDFAWHPSVMVNEDRLCHVVNTKTTNARTHEIVRIAQLAQQTKENFGFLYGSREFVQQLPVEDANTTSEE